MLASLIITPNCASRPTDDKTINQTLLSVLHRVFSEGGFLVYNSTILQKYKKIASEKMDCKYGPKFYSTIMWAAKNRGFPVNKEFEFITSSGRKGFNAEYAEFLVVKNGKKWGLLEDDIYEEIGPYKKNTIVKFRGISASLITKRLEDMSEIFAGSFPDREKIPKQYSLPIKWCKNIEIIDPYVIRQIYDGGLGSGRAKSGIEVLLENLIKIRKGKPLKRLSIRTSFMKNNYELDEELEAYKRGNSSKNNVRNTYGYRNSKLGMINAFGNLMNRFDKSQLYENLEFVGIIHKGSKIHNRFISFISGDGQFNLEGNKGICSFSNIEKKSPSSIRISKDNRDLNKHRMIFEERKNLPESCIISVKKMGSTLEKQISEHAKIAMDI